ncbi:MAG: hypothetical protein O9342_14635 [Beijerinckiaceae bacterium]|nr:hypothetical protein [Beijerinckiaceae bacterium]
MEPKFSIDRHRLGALLEQGDAANSAVKTAHEKLKHRQADAKDLLHELDAVRTQKAARPRYLDSDVEQSERDRHEAAITSAQAAYQAALDECQSAQAAYSARQSIAAEAMRLANNCRDYAASRGLKI